MNRKIRVLVIAPYENMKNVMMETVKEFEDIDLTIFVGDLMHGLLLAQRNFYSHYDVIVSRGGTASMLKEELHRPVVEIEISPLDILRAMKMGESISNKYAVIGFPNITRQAQTIFQIMESDIDIYTIQDVGEVEGILNDISGKGTHAILCDMCAYTIAGNFGLNPVLLQSGKECIRDAFEKARQMYYTNRTLIEENRFFRELVWKQMNQTVVFDKNGAVFFSTLGNNNAPIVEYLRMECGRDMGDNENRIIKQISNVRYSIRMFRNYLDDREYTVFCFTETKVSLPDIRRGIRYIGYPEAQEEFNSSIYGIVGLKEETGREIQKINQGDQPVLIFGEDGTCKEQAAKYLYLHSRLNRRPLVIIDCFMLNKKAWEYLMDHHNSPLTLSDCCLYFKNVDTLSTIQRKQLLANLMEMNVCRRNRVMFSCVCGSHGMMTAAGKDILETLCCLTLFLPPIHGEQELFRVIVSKYINHMNLRLQDPLLRITPEAMSALEKYEWPHNYTQFQRVLEEAATMSEKGVIDREDVLAVLKKENAIAITSDKVEDAYMLINLDQSLDKINYDIICRVLEEEQGNRTNAAERLGISRSTMWRIFKNRL